MSKKIVILYSGGLDSFIMRRIAQVTEPNAEIKCIYWDHGQPVAQKEIATLPKDIEVRKVDWLNLDGKTTVAQKGRREGAIMIPGRNLVFAVLTACEELPDEIWMGTLHGETHSKGTDKNFVFLEKTEELLNYVIGPFLQTDLTIRFPLAEMELNKSKEVTWALNNGLTQEQLTSTRSCHDGNSNGCGNCIQCFKRWCAFGENKISENYDIHPLLSDFGCKFAYDMVMCELGKDDYYEPQTRAEIIPFLKFFYKQSPEYFNDDLKKLMEKI